MKCSNCPTIDIAMKEFFDEIGVVAPPEIMNPQQSNGGSQVSTASKARPRAKAGTAKAKSTPGRGRARGPTRGRGRGGACRA